MHLLRNWPYLSPWALRLQAQLLQCTFLNRPNYSDIPASGLKPEDRVALHFQDPKQNNSAEFHNLMIDYDMGSHALALRYSDSQSDAQGLIDRDYAGAYVYGYPQEVRTNTLASKLLR